MRCAVLVLVACGRAHFDPVGDTSTPPGSVVRTFGETPDADVKGVTADTYLSSETMQSNFGADTSLALEGSEKRALLRFELTALAPRTPIIAASLHMYVTRGTGSIAIAPVTEAWTEGSGNGSPGVANYVMRTASQPWSSSGARAPDSAGEVIAMVDAAAFPQGVALPVSTVQGWVDTPSGNFGFVLSGGGDTSLESREATTATRRPVLVVTYLP